MGIVGIIQDDAGGPFVLQGGAAACMVAAFVGGINLRRAQYVHDVAVAADNPKTVAIGRMGRGFVPMDGVVFPQPSEKIVWETARKTAVVGKIHRRHD